MSYRIVYDLAATRFSTDTLNAVFPDHGFSSDQYLFFELGGDNNLYESYSSGHRTLQRRVRSWSLIAMGAEWEVMRQLVTFAASCEGGGMRFSGASETAAETYIRKCRTIVSEAVTPDTLLQKMGCGVSLQIARSEIEGSSWRQGNIEKLTTLLGPSGSTDRYEWYLRPLHVIKDAAALLAYGDMDGRPIYNMASVSVLSPSKVPLMKELQSRNAELF
ncbi:hypothetical protein WSS15_12020 [Acetobacter pasteurianus]|uniref:hypothetical protein n=1 Tax=Acetobacter pasteurianus TaxID=438 RepID=UPI0022C68429|nr:hypothetical protein [Acetobacter pasteurianus]GLH28552.1 hypothetical protein WSS15_12020 [Acetobacter pasteurianus]